ncbi:hypothetical protein LguiB_030573 [Lonicera macranthoides]
MESGHGGVSNSDGRTFVGVATTSGIDTRGYVDDLLGNGNLTKKSVARASHLFTCYPAVFSLGNMEGQSHRNSLTSLDAYNLSQLAINYPYQYYTVTGGRNESHYVPPTLPQWNQCQPMSHNYVKFLDENGASEIQLETSYNNSCLTSSFKPVDSYPDIDDQKLRYLRTYNEGAPVYNLSNAEQQIPVQAEESSEGHYSGTQLYPRLAIGTSGFPPKACSRVSRQRSTAADRVSHRRLRITKRMDALQELLPSTKQGGKASRLNDIIEHIKYLQLQVKGYGHYLFCEEMQKEPLEEMMGKLMEVNPTAAAQLLGSRGLFVMPMALAEGLQL